MAKALRGTISQPAVSKAIADCQMRSAYLLDVRQRIEPTLDVFSSKQGKPVLDELKQAHRNSTFWLILPLEN